MSLLPGVMSLNEAAYSVGFEATAYSSGARSRRRPGDRVDGQVADALTSASIAAQIGVADEVPPMVGPAAA